MAYVKKSYTPSSETGRGNSLWTDTYYCYCGNCGSWDIKIYKHNTNPFEIILGCLSIPIIIVAFIFWPIALVLIIFLSIITGNTPPNRETYSKADFKCPECGTTWKGIEGQNKWNIIYSLNDVPSGKSYDATYDYEFNDLKYNPSSISGRTNPWLIATILFIILTVITMCAIEFIYFSIKIYSNYSLENFWKNSIHYQTSLAIIPKIYITTR